MFIGLSLYSLAGNQAIVRLADDDAFVWRVIG